MNEDLAYIAGFLDADGSISIVHYLNQGYPRYMLKVHFTNMNVDVLKWIKDFFSLGGSIYCHDKNGNNKCRRLEYCTNPAQIVLEKLLPYIRVKRKQAELGIKFQSELMNIVYAKKKGCPAWLKEARDSAKEEISHLNCKVGHG